jgi:hypothetical protein
MIAKHIVGNVLSEKQEQNLRRSMKMLFHGCV